MSKMSITVLYILVNSYSFSCSLVFSSGNLLFSSYSSYNFTRNLLFSSCNSFITVCSFSTGNNVFMRTMPDGCSYAHEAFRGVQFFQIFFGLPAKLLQATITISDDAGDEQASLPISIDSKDTSLEQHF